MMGYHGRGVLVKCDVLARVHGHFRHEHDDSCEALADDRGGCGSPAAESAAQMTRAILTKIHARLVGRHYFPMGVAFGWGNEN
jgi:hypothetical protein